MSKPKTAIVALLLAAGCWAPSVSAETPADPVDVDAIVSAAQMPTEGTVVVRSEVDRSWFRAVGTDGVTVLGFFGSEVEIDSFVVSVEIDGSDGLRRCGDVGVPRAVGSELGGCRPLWGPIVLPTPSGPQSRPSTLRLTKTLTVTGIRWSGWGDERARGTGRSAGRKVTVVADRRRECGERGGNFSGLYGRLVVKRASTTLRTSTYPCY